jgi:hypothetical protein
MKLDIDSILYIIITIAILVISGLGSRRKKRAQQMEAEAQAAAEEDAELAEERKEETVPPPPTFNIFDSVRKTTERIEQQVSSDPLSRLEKFLTGQEPRVVSMEGETLEETVDEEEQILAEIRSRKEPESDEDKMAAVYGSAEDTEDNERESNLHGLFENIDEIKRAVIYSEILNRRY